MFDSILHATRTFFKHYLGPSGKLVLFIVLYLQIAILLAPQN